MSLTFTRHFFASQWAPVPEIHHSFAGQTVIVTGSNTGLGLESAKYYVRLGASQVILAVRTIQKGNDAKQKIEEATGRTGVVKVWRLDMSSYASVQEFAAKAKDLDRIDVLLENAGVGIFDWQVSSDGNEMTMAVNVYGTILLALLMIPLMRATAKKHNVSPVLTIVGSEAHHFTQMKNEIASGDPLAYLDEKKNFNSMSRYNISKLLELFYVRELAKHLNVDKHGVIINIANPGMCHSEFGRDMPWLGRKLVEVVRYVIARQTVDGARTLVWPSTAGSEGHGQYSLDGEFSEKAISRFVRSENGAELQTKLYNGINERLEKYRPNLVKDALAL